MKKKEEEVVDAEVKEHVDELKVPPNDVGIVSSLSRQSLKSLLKEKPEMKNSHSFVRVIEESTSANNSPQMEYKSMNLCNTKGANPQYAKGPNEKLLLEDYVKWHGPDPKNRCNSRVKANGANKYLLGTKCTPKGPNPNLRKGPMSALVKGNIFSVSLGLSSEACVQ